MEASGEGEIGMLSYRFGLLVWDLIILLMEELLHQLIGRFIGALYIPGGAGFLP